MGTRAQFFVGDPRDLEDRVWLGTVALDGYPDGDCGDAFFPVHSEAKFREAVEYIRSTRDDFCDPEKNDFPFPWLDDCFLTDYTYAWFDGKVMMTCFHHGFVSIQEYRSDDGFREEYHGGGDLLSESVPAPRGHGAPGPDSIIIVRARP